MKKTLLLCWLVWLCYAPAFAQRDSTDVEPSPYHLRFTSFEEPNVNGQLSIPFSVTAQQDVEGNDWRAVSDNKGFCSFDAKAAAQPLALSAGTTRTISLCLTCDPNYLPTRWRCG